MQPLARHALGALALVLLSGNALSQYEIESSLVFTSEPGSELQAFARDGNRLALAVDDAPYHGLAYRRTIDGTWELDGAFAELVVDTALLAAGIEPIEGFVARSVDVQRTEIVLGSPSSDYGFENSAGAVARFLRLPNGTWSNVEILTAPEPDSLDGFGWVVARSGPWIAVSNPGQQSEAGDGAVHVFRTTPGQPSTHWQVLFPTAPAGGSSYGAEIAFSGDTLVVTAPDIGIVQGSLSEGKVFVYELSPSDSWELVAELQSTDPDTYRQFALSVDIDGDLIAVGERATGIGGAGRAETFLRSPSGVWEAAQPIEPEYAYAPFEFGRSIAVDGTTVAIGARAPGPNNTGVVSVHEQRADGTWALARLLTGSQAAPEDLSDTNVTVGSRVSVVDGDVLTGDDYILFFEAALLARGGLGVSATNGGSQALVLHGGPERAFHAFVVLGSMSGLGPPTPIPGTPFVSDLVLDGYTDVLVGGLGAGVIHPFFGILDESGRASSKFALPAGTDPALIGTTLHHAYVTFQLVPFVEPALVSNSVGVEIVQ